MMFKIQSVKVGPERTNCYVVSAGGGETIVIDPGNEAEKIQELLGRIKNLDLRYILLTHGHYDHVGAVDDLKKLYPDVPVYLSENDMMLYQNLPEQGAMVGKFVAAQHAELEAISDGEFLPFADTEIEVIATPGHTPGGVCYLIQKTKDIRQKTKSAGVIFTGDTLFWHTIGRTDLPFSDDEEMRISLDRLKHLEGEYRVFPGHGKETTLAEEMDNNPFLKM